MENIAPALLEWFCKNQRILPFRTDLSRENAIPESPQTFRDCAI